MQKALKEINGGGAKCYLAFLPFLKIEKRNFSLESGQLQREVSHQEASVLFPMLSKIKSNKAKIFVYENKLYPSEKEILEKALRVEWKEIRTRGEFKNYGDLYSAMRCAIGAQKRTAITLPLLDKLMVLIKNEHIYLPVEGRYGAWVKRDIFNILKKMGVEICRIEDEFKKSSKEINLKKTTLLEFVEEITSQDLYIESKDKAISFSMGWDDFFYVMRANNMIIEKVKEEMLIEGFCCSENELLETDASIPLAITNHSS